MKHSKNLILEILEYIFHDFAKLGYPILPEIEHSNSWHVLMEEFFIAVLTCSWRGSLSLIAQQINGLVSIR